MYLQLADRDPYSHLAETGRDLYVFVPQGFRGAEKDMYIREDILDDLGDYQFQQLMFELEPYQNRGMSDKASREQRRADRQAQKKGKGPQARRDAKQLRVATRAEARKAGGGFMDKVGGIVGSVFGTQPGAQQKDGVNIAVDTPQGSFGFDNEQSFWEQYKTPILIGGGLMIVGGIIYFSTKKTRR